MQPVLRNVSKIFSQEIDEKQSFPQKKGHVITCSVSELPSTSMLSFFGIKSFLELCRAIKAGVINFRHREHTIREYGRGVQPTDCRRAHLRRPAYPRCQLLARKKILPQAAETKNNANPSYNVDSTG